MRGKAVNCWLSGMIGLAVVAAADSLVAQQRVESEQVFGRSVHQYFAGEFAALIDQLNGVVEAGSQDPRVFYYRGLAHLQLEQPQRAHEDIRQGAEWEAIQFGKRNYNIGRALQRVQGNDRALIETARAEAMQRRAQLVAAQGGIPRSQILAEMGRSILDPPPAPTSRPNLPDVSTLEADPTAPFGEGWSESVRPRTGQRLPAGAARETAAEDPFGQPPVSAARDQEETADPPIDAFQGDDDPFADPPTKPVDDPFGDPPARAADPFGDPPARAADPFGDPPARAADPFGDPPARAADPFGDPPPREGGRAAEPTDQSPINMENVDGRRVMGKLLDALTAPLRRAAEQGSSAMEMLPGGGFPGGGGGFPGDGEFQGDFPPGFLPPDGFPEGFDPTGDFPPPNVPPVGPGGQPNFPGGQPGGAPPNFGGSN